ncbi:hypothetical protein AWB68_05611 [Caballeronia choica]|uniref:Uncharacterized protein n=1 Tax=Caballeronia choica TaxID=326476 RepID=A0A158KE93_9BURK|nr:hypothetical protein AWB68_05611 [Caballeronia choica]
MPFHANDYPEFVCIVSAYSRLCYKQVATELRLAISVAGALKTAHRMTESDS